ncbi:hypothetical protein B0T21DRAFT_386401 [Apiosordaria backusii]|uniref:Uncharacterized protein n=1 Tax=Apiosordaria backusii TaxID=314023 RepID=A0AA40AT59_9PEZI|nr:hypothetical protein B0T21DRAFT_386401 [Apiosordaria backusii]
MSQTSHPTLINLPQPLPIQKPPKFRMGTPTSTATSLSALSTTAIKDGHKGTVHHHHHHHHTSHRGLPPQYDPSNSSLEAERADRISRLTGLGQPQMQNKMSTVGSASATEVSPSVGGGSVSGRSRTTTMRGRGGEDGDEDMLTEMDSASVAGASNYTNLGQDDDQDMMMDEDDSVSRRSAGTYDEEDDGRESLVGFGEGAGSTVSGPIYHRRGLPPGQQGQAGAGNACGLERSNSGFSEGVGGGPTTTTLNNMGMMTASRNNNSNNLGTGGVVGRGCLGFSDPRLLLSDSNNSNNNGGAASSNSDTPVSQTAVREIEQARMVDGVALEGTVAAAQGASVGDDVFVDTTTGGPVPVGQQPLMHPTSAIRETQQPGSHQHVAQQQALALQQAQQQQQNNVTSPSTLSVASGSTGTGANSREAAERIIREQFEGHQGSGGGQGLRSPRGGGERLGRFYFE